MFSLNHKTSARTRLNSSLPYRRPTKPDADIPALFCQSTKTCPRSPDRSSRAPPPLPPRIPLRPMASEDANQSPHRHECSMASNRFSPRLLQRKSSLSKLSQSITGSLRIRKRRSMKLKTKEENANRGKFSKSQIPSQRGNTQEAGGYFETLNQSMSCITHRGNTNSYSGGTAIALPNINSTVTESKMNGCSDFDMSVRLNQTETFTGLDTSRTCEGDSGVWTSSKTLRRSSRKLNLHSKVKLLSSRNWSTSSTKRRFTPDGRSEDSAFGSFDSLPSSSKNQKSEVDTERRDTSALSGKLRRVLTPSPCLVDNAISSLGPRPEPEGRSMSPPSNISGVITRPSHYNPQFNDLSRPATSSEQPQGLRPNNQLNMSMAWNNIEDSRTLNSTSILSARSESSSNMSFQDFGSRSFQSVLGLNVGFFSRSSSQLMTEVAERLNMTGAVQPSLAQSSDSGGRVFGRRYWRQEGLNQTFTPGLVSRL